MKIIKNFFHTLMSIAGSSLSHSLSLPSTQYTSLNANVDIVRDKYGIPHITAGNLWDMYFTQGVMIAHDRLWQLDLARRVASGRLSEIFGEKGVKKDTIQRQIRLFQQSKQKVSQLSEFDIKAGQAYLDGINSYIEATPKRKLPVEFHMLNYEPEPFTFEDYLANAHMKLWMNISWPADYVRHQVYRKMPNEMASLFFMDGTYEYTPHIDPYHYATDKDYQNVLDQIDAAFHDCQDALDLLGLGDPDTGSGTFVIGGNRTESGKPILALDTHQGFVAPNFFYPVHLTCPEYNVAGVTMPLVPGIWFGHNENISWGSIVFLSDNQDIFIEELNDTNTHYRHKGELLPLDICHEEIHVKGKKPVILDTYATHHGPILKQEGNYALAVANVAQHIIFKDIPCYGIGTAENFDQFKKALHESTPVPMESCYMDTNGNTGFVVSGLVPLRDNHDGSFPVPGTDGNYEWLGFVENEDLPWSYNIDEKYYNCANHKNDYLKNDRHFSTRWHPVYRGERTSELIKSSDKHTVDTVLKIQSDQLSLHARFLVPYVIEQTAEQSSNPLTTKILKAMSSWDYILHADSYEASIYNILSETVKRELLLPHIGRHIFGEYINIWPSSSISVEYILRNEILFFIHGRFNNYKEFIQHALEKSIDRLINIFKTTDYTHWKWGDIHQIIFKHPLGKIPFLAPIFNHKCRIGGDGEVIFTARSNGDRATKLQNFSKDRPGQHSAIFGSAFRCVFDANDWDNSHLVLNLGVGGNRFGGYYKNHFNSWLNNSYQPFIYSKKEIMKNCTQAVTLDAISEGPSDDRIIDFEKQIDVKQAEQKEIVS